MHKNNAPDATHAILNSLEELRHESRGSGAYNVIEHSSGKCDVTDLPGVSIGSSYGLLRVAPSGYYPNYLDIVDQNLVASKIIGLNRSQRSILTTARYDM
jgi:hypothetical protein